jgi:hypothetical protein
MKILIVGGDHALLSSVAGGLNPETSKSSRHTLGMAGLISI